MGDIVYTMLTNGYEVVGELLKQGWFSCHFKNAYYIQSIPDGAGGYRMGLTPFVASFYSDEKDIWIDNSKIIYRPVKINDSFKKIFDTWHSILAQKDDASKKAKERDEGLPNVTANNAGPLKQELLSVEGVEIYRNSKYKKDKLN